MLCILAGCAEEAAPPPQPPAVTVATPLQRTITEYDEYTGRLEAVERVDVRPRVSGYIETIRFTEGRHVKANDLLLIIDPRPFQAEVDRHTAQVNQAKAGKSLAEANLSRAESLIKTNSISVEELDIRRSEAQRAEADLEAANAALKTAKLDLSFTEVRAPIDGIIGRRLVTEGNLVTGQAQTATLLTTIVPHAPIYAVFEIDERSFLRNVRMFMEGDAPGRREDVRLKAFLGLDDEQGFPHEGAIDFASNELDADTATLTVRAIFENADEFLTPGLFARVRVPISGEKETLLIPDEAVGADQALRFVWVIGEDNTAERRTLQLGPRHEGLRVVRSGLQPDERIVIRGIQFVRPGATVNPQQGEISL